MGDPFVEFVGLRPKMYSFKVMEAAEYEPQLPFFDAVHFKHKSVVNGVSQINIKDFTHDDYFAMFREGEAGKTQPPYRLETLSRNFQSKLQTGIIAHYFIICRFTRWSSRSVGFVRAMTNDICLPICPTVCRTRPRSRTVTSRWRRRSNW